MTSDTDSRFSSFAEFYPYYLQEHSNSTCRRLHFVGTALVLSILAYVFATGSLNLLIALPFVGYGFAWVGHFFFEHNKPATFRYPRWSLMGDFVMFKDMLIGRVAF
ncbi:Mpo1-like protein [uncultured Pseudomonas sp.]|uniref:Mpo1-like protein n=1 Tax=uncultured Pseudomonas sp. TaxID=114707 RepID=UPI00262E28ED|nr:Mpo1-like protein [uncultured Pseudomonas sp.]